MSRPTIAVLSRSKAFRGAPLVRAVRAIQRQIDDDFAPAWGLSAELAIVPDQHAAPAPGADCWAVEVLDDADQAGAEGYHMERSGRPWGRVFAKTTLEDGGTAETTLGHEVLEMLADPFVNLLAEGPHGRDYAREVCDPPEDDRFSYKAADGTPLTDFVLPRYFDPHAPKGSRLDFRGHIERPFQVLPGGYLAYRNLGERDWRQAGPSGHAHDHKNGGDRYRHSRYRRRRGDHRPNPAEAP